MRKYRGEVWKMDEEKGQEKSREEWRAEYCARMERLKQVAATIDRGPGDKYFGADFHLAFNFLFGEVKVLQADPQLSGLHDRLTQILQASEVVLIDSISPVENRKRIAEMEKNNPTGKQ
jgi:hypothetical protein